MTVAMQKQELVTDEPDRVGMPITRFDSYEKVTGRTIYANDFKLSNMLHAKIKRSPYAHAIIKSIDLSKALKIKGVAAVVTGSDFKYTYNAEDPPPIVTDEVRYVGEPVAAVAAEDEGTAKAAVEEIDVEYEILPFALTAADAMSENAEVVVHRTKFGKNIAAHLKSRVGDVERGFNESDIIVENNYTTQMVQHLPMAPLTAVAEYQYPSNVNIYIGSQNANDVHDGVSSLLGLESSNVRVIQRPYVGGWFGMKGDVEIAAVCAMLAMKAKGNVRLQLSREEIFATLAVRHPAKIHIKDGLSKDGRLLARKVTAVFDGGAYARRSNTILTNTVCASTAIYRCKHFQLDTYRIYTNHVPSQNMRAPYGPQMYFAIESQMDMAARTLKMDPVQLRLKNTLKEGEKSVIGETIYSAGYEDCLTAVNAKLTRHPHIDNSQWRHGVGIALAAKWTGGNVPFAAVAKLKSDGKVEIWTSLVDVGEGIYTGMAQIAAQTLNLSPDRIVISSAVVGADSMLELPGTGPSGSRQLYHCGNAVVLACRDLRKVILELAAKQRQIPPDELNLKNGLIIRSDTGEKVASVTDLFAHVTHSGSFINGEAAIIGKGFWLEKVQGLTEDGVSKGDRVVAYYTPAATGVEVKVNAKTGELIVEKIVTALDAGRAINPLLVEGQIIGSGIMGLGYAVSEELHLSEDDGGILNPNLVDYKAPYAADSPEFVPIIIEHPQHTGPYGARGVGEAPLLAVAPAIANAVFDALGIRIRSLPLTPERIFTSLTKHTQP